MKISEDKFVSMTYDLYVGDDDDRELMESATKEHPLQFIFGMGSMLQDFEKNIENLEAGSKYSFTLTSEQAYGNFNESLVIELPKKIFEVDGKFDDKYIAEGATIPMKNANGDQMYGSVLEVKNDVVVMDFNHPLAGETLHYSGEILDVHDPTDEEVAAINQFMTGGCGGGCGECGGGCE